MTQEQYNRYMDGLVLKVASKKLNKTASFRKRAEKIGVNEVGILIPDIPSTGTGNGADVYKEDANRAAKEVQNTYDNIMNPKKSWLDVAKGYGKQGAEWVKAHPYITGGAAAAALAAGLVGAYLLRKNSKKNTKTASFRKRADARFPLLSSLLGQSETPEQKIRKEIVRAEGFKVNNPGAEIVPGLNAKIKADKMKRDVDVAFANSNLGKITEDLKNYPKTPAKGTGEMLTAPQEKSWIKENPVKAGLIGAAAVGIPAALIYAYYSRKNSKKSKK